MKKRLLLNAVVFVGFLATTVFAASSPVQNLVVTLRGKKYDVSDVTTVEDVQSRVKELSGISAAQQGRVLFGGKRLKASDILSEAGVSDGSLLNMVPASSTSSSSGSGSKGGTKAKSATAATTTTSTSAASSAAASSSGNEASAGVMEDYLKQAGIDTDKLDELVKGMGMGGEGGAGGGLPSMDESMKMMSDMMKSPIFQEYLSDPEKLEESRQMILNNPMLKSMMAGMPGMDQLLNDPVAWREAMTAAAKLYMSMDSDQLMKAMQGGMPPGGPGAGLFDGTLDNSAATAALDELDEDD